MKLRCGRRADRIGRLALGASAVLVLAVVVGCAPPRRAQLAQLGYRAVFDLGCPAGQLGLYHVDERTKVIVGCGRRLVYMEHCDSGAGNTCSWQLDTPRHGEAEWPTQVLRDTRTRAGERSAYGAQPSAYGRAAPTSGAQGRSDGTASSTVREGRSFRTDLFSTSVATLPETQGSRRPIRTELFESPPAPQPAAPQQVPAVAPRAPAAAPAPAPAGAAAPRRPTDITTEVPF